MPEQQSPTSTGQLHGLKHISSDQWMHLALGLIGSQPELARQFRFLDGVMAGGSVELVRKQTQQFIGASKCPSVNGCERLGMRTRWILSLMTGDMLPDNIRALLFQASLEKLLPACEGADDRNNLFRPAVRELVQKGLQFVATLGWSASEKVDLIFHLAMADQCTVVEPLWWWNAINRLDAAHALELAAHLLEQLPAIEPQVDRTWKNLGGRWKRLRLKSFLEHAQDKNLLADLLAKSALDDFEAAQAVELLRQTGRGREALSLAERWNRLMPASPVIGLALAQAYLDDGWDEEALKLVLWHYERDPDSRWFPLLERAAGAQWPVVRQSLVDSSK